MTTFDDAGTDDDDDVDDGNDDGKIRMQERERVLEEEQVLMGLSISFAYSDVISLIRVKCTPACRVGWFWAETTSE